MKDMERIVESEDVVLKVIAGRSSEDDDVLDTQMGDVGGCELGMCDKVSWEEVVEVLSCLKREKAPGPNGILNEMVVEVWWRWCGR